MSNALMFTIQCQTSFHALYVHSVSDPAPLQEPPEAQPKAAAPAGPGSLFSFIGGKAPEKEENGTGPEASAQGRATVHASREATSDPQILREDTAKFKPCSNATQRSTDDVRAAAVNPRRPQARRDGQAMRAFDFLQEAEKSEPAGSSDGAEEGPKPSGGFGFVGGAEYAADGRDVGRRPSRTASEHCTYSVHAHRRYSVQCVTDCSSRTLCCVHAHHTTC